MLSKYFRLTNYTWMFCEGYYLHRLLANTFEEERSLMAILSIGWGTNYLLKFCIRSMTLKFFRVPPASMFGLRHRPNVCGQQPVLGPSSRNPRMGRVDLYDTRWVGNALRFLGVP